MRRLTKVQQDACDVLAVCASSRLSEHRFLCTWDVAENSRTGDVASAAFEVADRMLDASAPAEYVYALAECLIRTGEVR